MQEENGSNLRCSHSTESKFRLRRGRISIPILRFNWYFMLWFGKGINSLAPLMFRMHVVAFSVLKSSFVVQYLTYAQLPALSRAFTQRFKVMALVKMLRVIPCHLLKSFSSCSKSLRNKLFQFSSIKLSFEWLKTCVRAILKMTSVKITPKYVLVSANRKSSDTFAARVLHSPRIALSLSFSSTYYFKDSQCERKV